MWYILALLSAFFSAVRKSNEKRLSTKMHHFTLGWTVQLFSLVPVGLLLTATGQFLNPLRLSLKFWLLASATWLGFYPLNTFFYISAMKHGELSKIMPMQSLGPILALIMGWLLLAQTPSRLALVGIVIVCSGVYALNLRSWSGINPHKAYAGDKATLYTIATLLLGTAASVLDAIIIKIAGPIYYGFIDTIGAVIILFVTSRLLGEKEPMEIKQNIKSLMTAGLAYGGTFITYLMALNIGSFAYVSTLRTGGALVASFFIGRHLKEDVNRERIIGIMLIGVGSLLVALW